MGNITPHDPVVSDLTELEVASALRAAATWVREAPAEQRCYGHLADDGTTHGLWPNSPDVKRWCAFGRACYEAKNDELSTWLERRNLLAQAAAHAFDARHFNTAARELEHMAAYIEHGLAENTTPEPTPTGEMVHA